MPKPKIVNWSCLTCKAHILLYAIYTVYYIEIVMNKLVKIINQWLVSNLKCNELRNEKVVENQS